MKKSIRKLLNDLFEAIYIAQAKNGVRPWHEDSKVLEIRKEIESLYGDS